MIGITGIGFEDEPVQDMVALGGPDLGLRALNPHRATDRRAATTQAVARIDRHP